jgi:hypothetical protein
MVGQRPGRVRMRLGIGGCLREREAECNAGSTIPFGSYASRRAPEHTVRRFERPWSRSRSRAAGQPPPGFRSGQHL